MATVNVYLSFDGNCEEAFNFYKSVFGGEFTYMGRYSDMPIAQGQPPIKEADKNKIMHVGLYISKETCIMGYDETMREFIPGNNFSLCVSPSSEEEAHKLFNALAVGAKITMPLERQFWNALHGMLIDKFGITWMVDFPLEEPK